MKAVRPSAGTDDAGLLALFRAVAARNEPEINRLLDASPLLASSPIRTGASRDDPRTYFLVPIGHYVYAGDTALHVAAASHLAAPAWRPADRCRWKGKTVMDATANEWIRQLLTGR